MILPIGLLTVAALLIISGITNRSITGVINGDPESVGTNPNDPNSYGGVGRGADTTSAPAGNSPKAIIDNEVLPLARSEGINVTPESVATANARHSPVTLTGSISDHNGPPNVRWAADMSNGTSPTKEMDALAKSLAQRFGISWSGSGAVSATHDGFRYQLIYRSLVGGNHYNHVHFGIKKVG